MIAVYALAFLFLVAMLGHILTPPKRGGMKPTGISQGSPTRPPPKPSDAAWSARPR